MAGRRAAGVFVGPDPDHLVEQAALFKGGTMQLIPPRPGSISSRVIELHQLGHRAAWRWEAATNPFGYAYFLYCHGHAVPLQLKQKQTLELTVNNAGQLAGWVADAVDDYARAVRFWPLFGSRTLLQPVAPTIPIPRVRKSTIAAMLSADSFDPFGREAIGVWRNQTFHTYFVEADRNSPPIADRLLLEQAV